MTNYITICYQRIVKIIFKRILPKFNALVYFSHSMKKLILIIVLFGSLHLQSQNLKLKATVIDSIAVEADDYIGFDGFGNQFYTKNNVLFKKNNLKTFQYQNLPLGKITRVDILNPLKVLVFYESFNTIVLLDSQLSEIQKIKLSENETPIMASAVGVSGQNKLWIYNSLDQQIGLYDINTNQYKDLGIPIKESFLYYQTDFNYFQWIDKQNQWQVCTIFGRIFSNGTIEKNTQVQLLDNDKLMYYKEGKLYVKNRTTAELHEIEKIEKSFIKFYYKDQILSIFTSKGITNYKIIIP